MFFIFLGSLSENLLLYNFGPKLQEGKIGIRRNTFAEKNLQSPTGNISWQFVKELEKVQMEEGLRLANSLSSQHINYKNRIMNVRLATQTMSNGVADAMEFLDNKCKNLQFEDSAATVEFIRKIDRVFDILNSRNLFRRGFKAPIRSFSLRYVEEIFSETIEYLESLEIDDTNILFHYRKTFALGFISNMKSALGLV